MNTQHNADIVTAPSKLLVGIYDAWKGDKIIASGTAEAMRLIVAGAIAQKLSVYDAEACWFLSGTLDQMEGTEV